MKTRSYQAHLITILGSLSLSLGVLATLWHQNQIRIEDFLTQWHQTDKGLLILVIVLSAAFHVFVGSHKLWCVINALSPGMTYAETLRIRLGVGPLRVLVPLDAGEFLNVFYLWRQKNMSLGRATGAATFDRGLNLLGAFFWLFVGWILLPQSWPSHWPSGYRWPLTGLGVLIYLIGFFCTSLHTLSIRLASKIHVRIGGFLDGVLSPFQELDWRRKLFFSCYALFFQIRPLIVCWLLFKVYGVYVTFVSVLAYGSLTIVATHVPGFVQGLGLREAILLYLFEGQASDETLLGVGILMTLSVHVIPMLLGLPWMMWFLKRLRSTAGWHKTG